MNETTEGIVTRLRRHGIQNGIAANRKEAADEIERLGDALQALVNHIERIAYRDSAGLRLGPMVPQFERAKEALHRD